MPLLKTFGVVFTTGDPSVHTGLVPVFNKFKTISGTAVATPTISELSSDGLYHFAATLLPNEVIYFVMDGATTSLGGNRYVSGLLDPKDSIDQQLTDHSSTLSALIGTTSSLFGDDATDPPDIFGYLKRCLEWQEGDAVYNKTTGVWSSTDRAGLTTIASKTLTSDDTNVTKV